MGAEQFTPEHVFKNTAEGMTDAAKVVLPVVAKVGKAALPGVSWAVDEIAGVLPGLRRIRPYTTRKWRAAAFYGKEEKHGK